MTQRFSFPYSGAFLFVAGFLTAVLLAVVVMPRSSSAQESCEVDQTLLTKLYDAVFHRPADAGAQGYVGSDVNFVLDQLSASQEHKMYTGIFTATKALEEREREADEVSDADLEVYKDYLDLALSTVREWAKTLPEQAREDAAVGPETAKNAIQAAYDSMNETAQSAANTGLFQATDVIGPPSSLSNPSGF